LKGKKSPTTIMDVASHASVSSSTVSRVVAGVGYVSPKTRARVLESIEELKFYPSSIAQSLRGQKSKVIGLVITDIQNPYYPELVRGIEDAAQKLGYSIILCNSSEDEAREEAYINLLLRQRASGLLICSRTFFDRHSEKLMDVDTKVVLVDTEIADERFPTVLNDGFLGGEMAARHLVECGYPQIVYLGAEEFSKNSQRYAGVVQGAGSCPVHYLHAEDSLESGRTVAIQAAKIVRPPFGIATHNDLCAIGAIRGLRSIGIDVPSQVGVVGYDDIAMSEYITPSLTTISQHQYDMGMEAMGLLEDLINGDETPRQLTISANLIVRESTTKIA
jgi:LacI family transcriptional regulator